MAHIPRTPVHFPRMKVRGRRNKAKLAARHTTLTVVPHARPERIATGYRFTALTSPEPGALRLEFKTVTDGYGRRVGVPQMQSIAPPKPTTYSLQMSFKPEDPDAFDKLRSVLLGGGEGDPVVQG